ncbi:NACHT, LRR and PYD domains-containing protein 5, partial [Varanus komodoensis]
MGRVKIITSRLGQCVRQELGVHQQWSWTKNSSYHQGMKWSQGRMTFPLQFSKPFVGFARASPAGYAAHCFSLNLHNVLDTFDFLILELLWGKSLHSVLHGQDMVLEGNSGHSKSTAGTFQSRIFHILLSFPTSFSQALYSAYSSCSNSCLEMLDSFQVDFFPSEIKSTVYQYPYVFRKVAIQECVTSGSFKPLKKRCRRATKPQKSFELLLDDTKYPCREQHPAPKYLLPSLEVSEQFQHCRTQTQEDRQPFLMLVDCSSHHLTRSDEQFSNISGSTHSPPLHLSIEIMWLPLQHNHLLQGASLVKGTESQDL